jgi:hypothetical protein
VIAALIGALVGVIAGVLAFSAGECSPYDDSCQAASGIIVLGKLAVIVLMLPVLAVLVWAFAQTWKKVVCGFCGQRTSADGKACQWCDQPLGGEG